MSRSSVFKSGGWFGTFFVLSCFVHILGMSSSQLTFIFFRGVGIPPTRNYKCMKFRNFFEVDHVVQSPGVIVNTKTADDCFPEVWLWRRWFILRLSLVGGLEHDFHFPMYWECHHPNWRTHIFQRGRMVIMLCCDANISRTSVSTHRQLVRLIKIIGTGFVHTLLALISKDVVNKHQLVQPDIAYYFNCWYQWLPSSWVHWWPTDDSKWQNS